MFCRHTPGGALSRHFHWPEHDASPEPWERFLSQQPTSTTDQPGKIIWALPVYRFTWLICYTGNIMEPPASSVRPWALATEPQISTTFVLGCWCHANLKHWNLYFKSHCRKGGKLALWICIAWNSVIFKIQRPRPVDAEVLTCLGLPRCGTPGWLGFWSFITTKWLGFSDWPTVGWAWRQSFQFLWINIVQWEIPIFSSSKFMSLKHVKDV